MSSAEEEDAEAVMAGSEDEPEDVKPAAPQVVQSVESYLEGEYIEPDWQPPKPSTHSQRDKVTTRYLTKYEKARVLGARALQIARNAPLQVDPCGETDALTLAEMELKAGRLPFTLRRYLPDGSFEDWPVHQLALE